MSIFRVMKYKLILTIILFSFLSVYAQKSNVKISIDGETYLFPSMNKKGIDYIPAKNLAETLSAYCLFNSTVNKVEIKFKDYTIKFTARNQFVILTSGKDNAQEMYQMFSPALLSMEDLLIPIQYSVEILSKACGKEIKILESVKVPVITESEKEEEKPVEKEIKTEEKTETVESQKAPKTSYDITGVILNVKANGTLIRLKSQKKINKFTQSVNKGVLSLKITGVTIDDKKINDVEPEGLVKKITAKNLQKNSQIDFHLHEGYTTSEVIRVEKSNDLLITIHNKLLENNIADKSKERWKFDAIVIDAGHGGRDPGAIGINKVQEKKINLAIALKLGELIQENLHNVRVIYTRSSDKFVELYRRGKIANEKNGKLFISIHCNSTPKKPTNANGFEVYLLRPGRTKEAIGIAEMENSVIKYEDNPKRYQELTDENFILVTMAHSSFMKYSEKFSEILTGQFKGSDNIKSGGVKQAGLYVLVGASMPGVLIESGYLSNKKDAAYLTSERGQADIAKAIFDAVKKFKDDYDKQMN
jgi:N-acetylmuramoyl-L-alanine amidase